MKVGKEMVEEWMSALTRRLLRAAQVPQKTQQGRWVGEEKLAMQLMWNCKGDLITRSRQALQNLLKLKLPFSSIADPLFLFSPPHFIQTGHLCS